MILKMINTSAVALSCSVLAAGACGDSDKKTPRVEQDAGGETSDVRAIAWSTRSLRPTAPAPVLTKA